MDIRALIAQRLTDERNRLGMTQREMADFGGKPMRTYQDWEIGKSTPSAEFLTVMACAGLDVAYVLTGVRATSANALTVEETTLVDNYRAATDGGRAAARAVLSAVEKQPSRPAKRAVSE